MIESRISAILLAGALVFSLAACGSSETAKETAASSESEQPSETAAPSESESETPEEEEPELAPDGVWETDGERVTIEDDTVTIDYIDEDGNVTETYWVGSFELDEDSDTWTSTRDPDAEMTAGCDTIEFTWEGTDNRYDTLSYTVDNADGTQTTVKLERTESLGEVAEGVVPDFSGSDAATGSSNDSAAVSESGKASGQADTSSAQSNTEAKTADSGSASVNTNTSADKNTSTDAGSSSSAQTSGNAGSSEQTGHTGSAASGSSSSSSSGSTGSSNGGSSSGSGSGSSSGTAVTACSHNYAGTTTKAATCTSAGTMTYICTKCGDSYQTATPATGHSYNGGTVTKAATCSSAGATTYTCTKCGDSYTTSIPATGNHNWQAVYRTESVKVQDAVYEERYICNNCFNYSSRSKPDVQMHIDAEHNGVGGFTVGNVCIQNAVYENQQVFDHYVCNACGATK